MHGDRAGGRPGNARPLCDRYESDGHYNDPHCNARGALNGRGRDVRPEEHPPHRSRMLQSGNDYVGPHGGQGGVGRRGAERLNGVGLSYDD